MLSPAALPSNVKVMSGASSGLKVTVLGNLLVCVPAFVISLTAKFATHLPPTVLVPAKVISKLAVVWLFVP